MILKSKNMLKKNNNKNIIWKERRFENTLRLEIMTSVDADLRSGRRLESGRRSESIIS